MSAGARAMNRGPRSIEVPRIWRLTPAETRAVRGLVSGQKPLEIAGSQAVSVHTIRTHLKRAMVKAGVHSQAALVSRVFFIER
jgi:DNA-binding CsgD family transcriptional regulator